MGIKEFGDKPRRHFVKLKLKHNENNTFVLLEGPRDRSVWWKFRAKYCDLIPVHSKDSAITTLQMVSEKRPSWRNVVAIIDPDLWLIEQSHKLHANNLLFDDVPDLEMTLLSSSALENFICITLHNIDPRELSEFTQELKDKALYLATEYGYFRLVHHQCPKYGLRNLKKVATRIREYIDDEMLNFDLIAEKLLEGSKSKVTKTQLLEQVENLRANYPPPEIKLCRGKDVCSIMAAIMPTLFSRKFNDNNSLATLMSECRIENGRNHLVKELCKCYDYHFFIKTALFRRIREWESNNTPYRIIRQEG